MTSRMPRLWHRSSNSWPQAATVEAQSHRKVINKIRRIRYHRVCMEQMPPATLPRMPSATRCRSRAIMERSYSRAIPRRRKISLWLVQSDLAAPLQLQALPRCQGWATRSPAYAVINPPSSRWCSTQTSGATSPTRRFAKLPQASLATLICNLLLINNQMIPSSCCPTHPARSRGCNSPPRKASEVEAAMPIHKDSETGTSKCKSQIVHRARAWARPRGNRQRQSQQPNSLQLDNRVHQTSSQKQPWIPAVLPAPPVNLVTSSATPKKQFCSKRSAQSWKARRRSSWRIKSKCWINSNK